MGEEIHSVQSSERPKIITKNTGMSRQTLSSDKKKKGLFCGEYTLA